MKFIQIQHYYMPMGNKPKKEKIYVIHVDTIICIEETNHNMIAVNTKDRLFYTTKDFLDRLDIG